jgi:hypothetical protein
MFEIAKIAETTPTCPSQPCFSQTVHRRKKKVKKKPLGEWMKAKILYFVVSCKGTR